ncbi:MAG: leucine-rich repeat protein [Firmicutes bacterium]|nr:leucine-rich repeat protein [Bacillota bacterium]
MESEKTFTMKRLEGIKMLERIRRGLILILVCAFVVTSAQSSLEAYATENTVIAYTEGVEGGAIYFDTATGTVTGCDESVISVVLPEKINGVNIVYIGKNAFRHCVKLKKITISTGITSIGDAAFVNCTRLREIIIPEGVTSIGDAAFNCCISLNKITIPKGVTFIGDGAFSDCWVLQNITIPEGVTSIGDTTFENCQLLEDISIPESITYIGYDAFRGCSRLKRISIPNNVTYIGSGAFEDCRNLIDVAISARITSIEKGTFKNCSSLKEIVIPKEVTSIGSEAFYCCTNLSRVKIPDEMAVIGYESFYKCCNLEEIIIPRGVEYISSSSFRRCDSLQKVVILGIMVTINGGAFAECNTLDSIWGYPGFSVETYAQENNIPFKPINLSTSVPNGKYGIFVTDSSGKPIKGAKVSCESYNLTTDSKGRVLLPLYGFSDRSVITVSHTGYGTYTNRNTNYEKNEQGYDIVVLYRSDEQHLRLKGVLYNNSQDLMVKTKRITLQNDVTGIPFYTKFSLKCLPIESGKIAKYELWQGNNKISTTTNGIFSLIETQFSKGKGIVVRTYDTSGKRMDTHINLEFVKSNSSKNSIEIGEKLKITISDDIPILGGQSIDIDLLKALPLEMKISDDSVYFGLNVNKFQSQSDKDIKKSMNLLKEGAISVNSKNKKNIENLIKRYGASDTNKKFKVSLIGYGEAKLNKSGYVDSQATIYLGMKIEAKISGEWNCVIYVVPVTAQIDGKLSGEFGGKLVINPASGKVDADLVIKPKASASLYLGVGIGKALSAGGYGSVEGSMEWIPFGSNSGVQTVDATLEAGIKAYVAYFEWKKGCIKKTWNLYTRTKGAKMQSVLAFAENDSQMFNGEAYHLQETGYLANESEWLGAASGSKKKLMKKAASGEGEGIQFMDLLQGTYENSMPSIASNGEKMVMAYLAADPMSDVQNMTRVMYSVFDESTGSWKQPVALYANGTGDYAPKLYSDGKDIYIIYQDTDKVLSEEETSISDYAKSQTIVAAWFDNESESFMEIQTLSDETDKYLTDAVMGFVDNRAVAVWVSNPNTEDVFCQNSTNEIHMRPMWGEETTVLARDLNCITALVVSNEGIVYATDTDNDLSTCDDQKMYLMDFEGHTTLIDEGMISSVRLCKLPNSAEDTLVWLKDGVLTKLENNHPAVIFDDVSVNGDFYVEGDSLYYVAMEETGSNFYSRTYDSSENRWIEPVKLTDSKKLIEFPTVISHNGRIYTCFVNTQMAITDENVTRTCNLCLGTLNEVTDLVLTDVEYNPADAVDGLFPIKITFKNCGTKTVERSIACIKDKDDETQYLEEMEIVETLLPGQETQASFYFNTRDIKEGRILEVDIHSAEGSDQTPDNNVEHIKMDYADLAVNSELIQVGDIQYLYVTAINKGEFSTSGMMDISCKDKMTYLSHIPELEPGEKATNVINLSENGVSNNVSDVININITADKEEMELYDNRMSMYLDLEYDIIYDANGGAGTPEIGKKIYDIDYQIPSEQPVRDGYTFVGWSTDESGTAAEYTSGDMIKNNRSMVLYAVWRNGDSGFKLGDVNGDGKINVTDINLVRLHILGRKKLTEEQERAADINYDSKINVTDINLIRLHILGRKNIS